MAEDTTLTRADVPESTAPGTWRESLPEELRDAGSLKDIPDVQTLAKAYTDAQSYIGRSIRIPGDDASPEVKREFHEKLLKVPGVGVIPTSESSEEEWGRFYGALGRPDAPTGYSIERNSDLPGDPEVETALLTEMHKLGLTNNQATGLINWMNEGQQSMHSELESDMRQASDQLKQEWGAAYDDKLSAARSALQAYGDDDFVAMLEKTGLGDSPHMIKAFAKIGENLSEDVAKNLGEGAKQAMTPAEAIQQIAEIRGNSNHPFNDPSNPSHKHETARMAELYQYAYGANDSDPDMFEQAFRNAG